MEDKKEGEDKKLMLNIGERIAIRMANPPRARFLDGELWQTQILPKVRPTEEEVQQYEIKPTENGGVSWNEEGKEEKEIVFTELEFNLIAKEFKQLDKEGLLPNDKVSHSVYKKFVGG